MTKYKPVSIPSAAFAFCRYGVALMLWVGLILQLKWLIVLVVIILFLSALLRVGRAPMIVIYKYTINLIVRSPEVVVNEHAMRFAHLVGATIGALSLLLLYFVNDLAGWIMVALLATLKSISALGYCPASKLYECMTGGSCFIKPPNGSQRA
jgi:hypothetical protein